MSGFGAGAAITATVLTKYKGDASDQIRALKKIKGEEAKNNAATIKGLQQKQEKYDKLIGTLGKVTLAVGAIGLAMAGANKAMKSWADDTRLRSAAVGVNIDRLKKSSQGLVSEMDLLKFAAQANNAEFKLTQAEMEKTVTFMVELNRKGHDMSEVFEEVKKSAVEADVGGLKKFGVTVEGIQPGLKAHEFMMKKVAAATGGVAHAGEEATVSGVALKDAMHEAGVSIGRLAKEVLPPLISGLAKIIDKINDAADLLKNTGFRKSAEFWSSPLNAAMQAASEAGEGEQKYKSAQVALELEARIRAGLAGAGIYSDREQLGMMGNFRGGFTSRGSAAGGGRGGRGGTARNRLEGMDPFGLMGQYFPSDYQIGSGVGAFAGQSSVQDYLQSQRLARGGGHLGDGISQEQMLAREKQRQGGGDEDWWANINAAALAGENEKITSQIDSINKYSGAFNVLQSSATAAYAAIVTGSGNVGQAIKEAAGQALLAEGTRLMGVAVSEGVMALVGLAMGIGGNPYGFAAAAAHGKAAAAAGAGAVALGGLARALGAGGSIPGGGRGVGTTGAGAGRGGGNTSNTYIIGDGVLTGNKRQNAANIKRVMERAERDDNGNRDAVGSYG